MIVRRSFSAALLVSGLMYPALTACGQIYKLAEMNTRQIRALEFRRSVDPYQQASVREYLLVRKREQ